MSDSFFQKLSSTLKPDRVRSPEDLEGVVREFEGIAIRQTSHEKVHFDLNTQGKTIELKGYLPYPSTCEVLKVMLQEISILQIQFNVFPMDPRIERAGFIGCQNKIHGLSGPLEKSECAHVWEPDDPIRVFRKDRGYLLCQAGDGYLAWVNPEELSETLKMKFRPAYPPMQSMMPFLNWQEVREEWEGVPYVWGGTGKEGVDCSGFVMRLYQEAGIQIPRDSHQQMLIGRLVETEDQFESLKDGDLLFFTHDDGRIGHVGISLGGMRVLHAQEGGVCTFSLDPDDEEFDPYRAKHFVFAKRLLDPY